MNRIAALLMAMSGAGSCIAAEHYLDDTTVWLVAVNGGADTVNAGTSCIKVTSPVSPACTAGYIAIPNNNKNLLATVLTSKAVGNKIWLYYFDTTGSYHCPGLVFTPCAVNSIQVK
jgi:hypothetical protein